MKDDELSRLHEALLKLLDELDRVCRENGIPYFLDSGTALGAVRHGGFIPWDDDADVGMLRGDYERFLRAAGEQLKPGFFLQTHDTDPGFLKFSAKLRLDGTFFPENLNSKKSLHQGIFIDIFPFDSTSDDRKAAVRETDAIRRIYRLWMIRNNESPNDNALRRIVKRCAKILPSGSIRRRYEAVCSKHPGTGTLTCYAYKMNDDHYLYFDASDFEETVDVAFEGRTYSLMKGWDSYLRTMYGDYMQLPPEEKRVSHLEGGIIFG